MKNVKLMMMMMVGMISGVNALACSDFSGIYKIEMRNDSCLGFFKPTRAIVTQDGCIKVTVKKCEGNGDSYCEETTFTPIKRENPNKENTLFEDALVTSTKSIVCLEKLDCPDSLLRYDTLNASYRKSNDNENNIWFYGRCEILGVGHGDFFQNWVKVGK